MNSSLLNALGNKFDELLKKLEEGGLHLNNALYRTDPLSIPRDLDIKRNFGTYASLAEHSEGDYTIHVTSATTTPFSIVTPATLELEKAGLSGMYHGIHYSIQIHFNNFPPSYSIYLEGRMSESWQRSLKSKLGKLGLGESV